MSRSILSHSGSTTDSSSEESLSHTHSNDGSTAGSHTASHTMMPLDSDQNTPLRLLRRIFRWFDWVLLAFSDWAVEWTPFTLVTTYYIVSTAIFVMCSVQAIKILYFFFSKPVTVRRNS